MVDHQEPTTVTINSRECGRRKQGLGEAGAAEEERLCGGAAAARGLGGACAAEAAGAALLVLLTCLPACADASPLQRALAGGLAVATLVQCFDHISGAMMNPAVTLAAVVMGRVGRARGAAFVLAQLCGCAGGAAALQLLAPGAARCCVTRPAPTLRAPLAAAVEALLGALLALANCAAWDARNRCLCDSWPLRIGLTVAALTLAAGPLTGASMNPARSLGPALVAGEWAAHWVYWLGPLGGALGAALLYRALWRAPAFATPRGL